MKKSEIARKLDVDPSSLRNWINAGIIEELPKEPDENWFKKTKEIIMERRKNHYKK